MLGALFKWGHFVSYGPFYSQLSMQESLEVRTVHCDRHPINIFKDPPKKRLLLAKIFFLLVLANFNMFSQY